MSWPYPYSYQQQLNTHEFLSRVSPFEAQLLLHLLRQKSLIDSLASSSLKLEPNFNPFSVSFNRLQQPPYHQCQTGLPMCSRPVESERIFSHLKKQQSLSGEENMSESSSNAQQQQEKIQLQFPGRRSFPRPKNMISHNSSLRNDTKNIPKNYGKAMLSYIQKNSRQVKEILSKHSVDYLQFMIFVKSCKSKINTMHDLRQMWGQNQPNDKFKKCTRILSYHFMRKKCLPYIFNSRIKNFHTHIKYRKKIMEGIQNPENFTKIKEF